MVCHGIPNEKPLKEGDILNVDITVIKDGYHGDTSKMFLVGKTPEWADRLCQITQECQGHLRPRAPGRYRRNHPEARGKNGSVVREYRGHGIGKVFHEEPQVLHYGRGYRHRAEGRHDLHHRADDQPGPPGDPPARRRLDRDHQGPQAVRAMGSTPCWSPPMATRSSPCATTKPSRAPRPPDPARLLLPAVRLDAPPHSGGADAPIRAARAPIQRKTHQDGALAYRTQPLADKGRPHAAGGSRIVRSRAVPGGTGLEVQPDRRLQEGHPATAKCSTTASTAAATSAA